MKKIKYIYLFLILSVTMPGFTFALEWINLSVATDSDLRGLWGSSATDIYAVGGYDTTVLLYNGMRWSDQEEFLPDAATADIHAVWGSTSKNVFIVGGWGYYGINRGHILQHNNKKTWKVLTKPPNAYRAWINELRGVWGTSKKDYYVVGERNFAVSKQKWIGPLIRYNERNHFEPDNPRQYTENSTLYDIWGSSPSDVYTVGTALEEVCVAAERRCAARKRICREECIEYAAYDYTNIMHYDGNNWTLIETGVDADLYSVWGSSANDVFAVGTSGTILHYDGNSWTQMSSTTENDLNALWGFAADNVYAVGDNGTVLNYDGNAWSAIERPTSENLNAIWGPSDDRIYIAGNNGTLILYTRTMDFGDAPDPDFPSLLYNDGPYHEITNQVWLGNGVDTEHEAHQQLSDNHTEDDYYDDGVEFLGSSTKSGGPYSMPFAAGQYGAVKITVNGLPTDDCYLHGWIDWKGDKDWKDQGDNIFCGYRCTAPGEYIIEFTIPKSMSAGCKWARFRLDWNENLCSYKGSAKYGEVEDYEICPTLIELAAFTATPFEDKVIIEWTTTSEIDNAGFNLYRSETEHEDYLQLNNSLLPPEGSPEQGASYAFTDNTIESGKTYYYMLEDIDTNGTSTMHGPVTATPGSVNAACYAMDDIAVKAGTPENNIAAGTGLESCYADITFKNNGSKTVKVLWYTIDSYDADQTGWRSAILDPGEKHTGVDPGWGYVELMYGNTRTITTTEATAFYYEGTYVDECGLLENTITGGLTPSTFPTVSVEDLNPCR